MALLVELIEKERLAISEISLAHIADDYIRYVRGLERIDPEALAEFLVVASELMLIKSRSLLPSLQFSEEEEESIEELEKRLEEYKRIRGHALELKKLEGRGFRIFTRDLYHGMEPIFFPPHTLTAERMHETFVAFIQSLPKIEKLEEEKIKKIISLEEKISHIKRFLEHTFERAFSHIIGGSKEKIEIIVSFLAILELAKQQFVELRQEKPFEEIIITKK